MLNRLKVTDWTDFDGNYPASSRKSLRKFMSKGLRTLSQPAIIISQLNSLVGERIKAQNKIQQ
jgi:hypothetical protein